MFLSVKGLSKSFGDLNVLKNIDIAIDEGNIITIIGPSGSGKTTLLRCLNGLEIPDQGRLVFHDGFEVEFGQTLKKKQLMELSRKSGMVFQSYNLFPHKSALQNVTEGPLFVQKRNKLEVLQLAESILKKVGLADKKDLYPHQLSGGQQQRVGIARALAIEPELMLFDEPTSALDPELVGDVLKVMKDLAKEGWTMVIVTHELRFAEEVADTIIFMDQGQIVEQGPPSQVLRNPTQERTSQFIQRVMNPS
ncbi:ATP-binding cassette domain-containing protein [Ornithinibacillus sp. L9]|uniref:ATP-binding cassette domain-containing protein n=1 Tax=Ornithinibacillus caprae TaxID=2678566 RepID=A0A6N8FIZ1_9BACI|nr:amino acid ABC transporter ATP-binding protein [Ornithinibacillus caprae]MUK87739.1 ATP-binding cassette domain-containing protein [Ornithinibacillus caprae]